MKSSGLTIDSNDLLTLIQKQSENKEETALELFEYLKNNKQQVEQLSFSEKRDIIFSLIDLEKPSKGFNIFKKAGILGAFLPEVDILEGVSEINGQFHKDVYHHTMKVVDNISEKTHKKELRLAALLHDIGKPATKKYVEGTGWAFHGHDEIGAGISRKLCRRLKIDNSVSKFIYKLTKLHLRPINLSNRNVTDSAIRRLITEAGDDLEDLLIMCRTDITSGNKFRVKKHLENFDFVRKRIVEVIEKDKESSFRPALDGHEIMKICGIQPGKTVGLIKKDIDEAVKSGKIQNDHDKIVEYLNLIKNKYLE
ncbi:HDIG domain-containing metalloprotein [candidate division KSB1 bacterium]